MSCKITCPSHHRDKREFEVTPEGRVWPCCYYANAWEMRFKKTGDDYQTLKDDGLWKVMQDNPKFNHLDHYSLREIINTPYYQTECYFPGWESDNPPHMCEINCGEEYDEALGKSKPKSLLGAKNQITGEK